MGRYFVYIIKVGEKNPDIKMLQYAREVTQHFFSPYLSVSVFV